MKLKNLMTKKDENGLAAIIIVTVLIVLLSLITVGFSRLMSRSTNDSLNNQLSASAGYAAQSGVNDALKYIKDQYTADPTSQVSANSCNQLLNGALADQTNISTDGTTKVTCLLVNPTPKDLVYQQIPEDGSQVVKLNTSASLDSLMVSWRSNDNTKRGFPAGLSLTSIDSWGTNNPILRVSLYPIPQSKLVAGVAAKTFFLFPRSASATFTHISSYGGGAVADGSIVPVNCGNKSPAPFNGSADYDCNTTFDNLSSALAPSPTYFYVRLTPLYNNADLKIKANDSTKNALSFNHDQAVIDVTAKAGAAVKRVQERVDTNLEGTNISPSADAIPEVALRTALSLCKRLNVTSGPINTTVDGGICSSQGGGVVDAPPAPTPVTGGYSNLTYNSADVVGTVNPNAVPVTDCRFVYGTNAGSLSYSTSSYSSCSSLPGSGKSPVGVSAHLSGLNGATKYYYALCARNDYASACDTSKATGGGGGGSGGSFDTPWPPPSGSISFNGTVNSNPNFGLSFNYRCDWSTSSSITVNPNRNGGGQGTQPQGGTSSSDGRAGGPYSYGNSGNAYVTCSGPSGTYNSGWIGWRIPWPAVNVSLDYLETFSWGTKVSSAPNDCRDSVHTYIACMSWHADQGGDSSMILGCTVGPSGAWANNGRGQPHWSSQGHWIYYTQGWSSYPARQNITLDCVGQGNVHGGASGSAYWTTCQDRGQIGTYYSDFARNNCQDWTPPPSNPPSPPSHPGNPAPGPKCPSGWSGTPPGCVPPIPAGGCGLLDSVQPFANFGFLNLWYFGRVVPC